MEINNQSTLLKGLKVTLVTALLAAVTAIVLFGGFWKDQAHAETNEPDGSKHVINVSGKAELKVEPDVAYVNVSVQTSGKTAKEAQTKNAAKFAAIQRVLFEKFKLTKQEVQTVSFYVNPQYRYTEKEGQKLTGYSASHGIRITYRKLDQIGDMLDSLSGAGANHVDGVQFGLEKKDAVELKALELAMANAKGKAEVLAAAADRQLQGVISVTQGVPAGNRPYEGLIVKAMNDSVAESAASTSVERGQITVVTEVSVSYEMK
jgi:uncharacterized protein YggE